MFADNIKKISKENKSFRRALYTGNNSQLVVMNIPVGGDIGEEVHPSTDQILFLVEGSAEAVLNGVSKNVGEHDVVFVPAGTTHNFKT